ncbi:dolichyl-phosphate beta-glucosyltransferase [Perkinsus chesapeaki]|uniref:dolichyl-phosphate beta-glucosyltransferase n=1 Tax=Perkinsus chesapeaki TaxID=330153 RepID=A0A7J6N3H7_PERCH|nr:dolichyl-phosphate beta-glucosyltransferase [Perkinsus chesapeaki]
MASHSTPLQNQYQETVAEIQDVQERLQKLYGKVRTLTAQKSENEQVKKEFDVLEEDGVIWKLVGPIMVRQDRDDAVSNVEKRLEFITSDLDKTNETVKGLEEKLQKKSDELEELQQKFAAMHQSGAAGAQTTDCFRMLPLEPFSTSVVLLVVLVVIALVVIFYPYIVWRKEAASLEGVQSPVARISWSGVSVHEAINEIYTEASVDLSMVVPAHNESERLPLMYKETIGYLRRRLDRNPSMTCEIIIVNDGSRDATEAVALRLARENTFSPNVTTRVVGLARNMGKGAAVRYGVRCSRGRRILMVDADGATRIDDLDRLEEVMDRDPNISVAFGSRDHLRATDAVAKRSPLRNVFMGGFHFVVWLIVGTSIRDTQCGFKLFTRDAARDIFSTLHLNRWAFDIEIVLLAQFMGLRVVEVPVNWTEIPGSKLHVISASLQMLRDIASVRIFYAVGLWQVEPPSPCRAEVAESTPTGKEKLDASTQTEDIIHVDASITTDTNCCDRRTQTTDRATRDQYTETEKPSRKEQGIVADVWMDSGEDKATCTVAIPSRCQRTQTDEVTAWFFSPTLTGTRHYQAELTRLFNFLFGPWKEGEIDPDSQIAHHSYVRKLQARLVLLQQELDYAKSMNLDDIKRSLKRHDSSAPTMQAPPQRAMQWAREASANETVEDVPQLYEVRAPEGIDVLDFPCMHADKVGYLERGSQFVARSCFLALQPRGWISLGYEAFEFAVQVHLKPPVASSVPRHGLRPKPKAKSAFRPQPRRPPSPLISPEELAEATPKWTPSRRTLRQELRNPEAKSAATKVHANLRTADPPPPKQANNSPGAPSGSRGRYPPTEGAPRGAPLLAAKVVQATAPRMRALRAMRAAAKPDAYKRSAAEATRRIPSPMEVYPPPRTGWPQSVKSKLALIAAARMMKPDARSVGDAGQPNVYEDTEPDTVARPTEEHVNSVAKEDVKSADISGVKHFVSESALVMDRQPRRELSADEEITPSQEPREDSSSLSSLNTQDGYAIQAESPITDKTAEKTSEPPAPVLDEPASSNSISSKAVERAEKRGRKKQQVVCISVPVDDLRSAFGDEAAFCREFANSAAMRLFLGCYRAAVRVRGFKRILDRVELEIGVGIFGDSDTCPGGLIATGFTMGYHSSPWSGFAECRHPGISLDATALACKLCRVIRNKEPDMFDSVYPQYDHLFKRAVVLTPEGRFREAFDEHLAAVQAQLDRFSIRPPWQAQQPTQEETASAMVIQRHWREAKGQEILRSEEFNGPSQLSKARVLCCRALEFALTETLAGPAEFNSVDGRSHDSSHASA